jgi:hypothetical protein
VKIVLYILTFLGVFFVWTFAVHMFRSYTSASYRAKASMPPAQHRAELEAAHTAWKLLVCYAVECGVPLKQARRHVNRQMKGLSKTLFVARADEAFAQALRTDTTRATAALAAAKLMR